MHQTVHNRAGDIGPIRREIVFEPVPEPARPVEQPALPRPAGPAPVTPRPAPAPAS